MREMDDFTVEIIIAHEFSHILDKGARVHVKPYTRFKGKMIEPEKVSDTFLLGHHPLFRKKQFRAKTIQDKIKLVNAFMDSIDFIGLERKNNPKWASWYMKKETEVEAHVGMIDYAVNLLLKKNPEKAEKLKELLGRGDMKSLLKLFPELMPMEDHFERMLKYEKIKKRLQKRLVITLSSAEVAKEPLKIQLSPYGISKDPKFKEEYTALINKEAV